MWRLRFIYYTGEANFCGSSARLQAAYQVINSIVTEKYSLPLRYTTLAKDALGDEGIYIYIPYKLMKITLFSGLSARNNTIKLIFSMIMRYFSTESVAIDMTLEEMSIRGYLTRNINTHIVSMQSARATAFHSPS